jgi:hypothetical protein
LTTMSSCMFFAPAIIRRGKTVDELITIGLFLLPGKEFVDCQSPARGFSHGTVPIRSCIILADDISGCRADTHPVDDNDPPGIARSARTWAGYVEHMQPGRGFAEGVGSVRGMAERGVNAHWYLPPPGIPHRPGEVLPFGRVDLFTRCRSHTTEIRDHREPATRHDRLFVSEAPGTKPGMFHKDSSKR